jgi:hypothetical protein
LIFVEPALEPSFCQIVMASCSVNRAGLGPMYTESPPLNGAYPENDADAAERTSPNKVNRLRPGAFPRSQGFKNTQIASDRPSIARRIIRALGRFCVAVLIGVGATLAWQSYGGEMVRAWAPSLGWLAPASRPGPAVTSTELQQQLKPMAIDLALVRRSEEQLAANQDQLARKQDQMTQAFATLQAAEQDIKQNILALAPPAPKAAHVPPSKPSQAAAQ